jgi:hypothetical protein
MKKIGCLSLPDTPASGLSRACRRRSAWLNPHFLTSSIGLARHLGFKKLLCQRELNVTPLSQEDEYKTQIPVEKNFSFSIFFL